MAEKNAQLTSSDQALSSTPESLSDSQRQVLAKVYRFLLGLKRAPTKEDSGKETANSETLHTGSSLKTSVKPPNK